MLVVINFVDSNMGSFIHLSNEEHFPKQKCLQFCHGMVKQNWRHWLRVNELQPMFSSASPAVYKPLCHQAHVTPDPRLPLALQASPQCTTVTRVWTMWVGAGFWCESAPPPTPHPPPLPLASQTPLIKKKCNVLNQSNCPPSAIWYLARMPAVAFASICSVTSWQHNRLKDTAVRELFDFSTGWKNPVKNRL